MDKERKTQIMRLDEILSSNQIIINLKKMRINFLDDFNFIKETHLFFVNGRVGISRHQGLLGNIEILENNIKPFLDYDFDPDPDIDQLKLEANNIIVELNKIKKQIP